MNFKNLIFITFLILVYGCGVKSTPVPPPGTGIPSYLDRYYQVNPDVSKENEEEKKSDTLNKKK